MCFFDLVGGLKKSIRVIGIVGNCQESDLPKVEIWDPTGGGIDPWTPKSASKQFPVFF